MRLSDLRETHDLTQEQIVKFTGIPYNTYRRYEYGETFPKADAIISLAHLYDLLPGELFQLLNDEEIEYYPEKETLTAELNKYKKWLAQRCSI